MKGAHDCQARIRRNGFAARIYPEFPDGNDVTNIARLITARELEFWIFEFSKRPLHVAPRPVGSMLVPLFDASHVTLLIKYRTLPLFVLSPQEHEYFVVFGRPDLVQTIDSANLFRYGFDDYLSEQHFSGKTIAHLQAMREVYHFG